MATPRRVSDRTAGDARARAARRRRGRDVARSPERRRIPTLEIDDAAHAATRRATRPVVPLRPRRRPPAIDPAAMLRDSRRALARRLPRAGAALAPEARREIPWHAALLTGGLSADRVIGGHIARPGSTYSYVDRLQRRRARSAAARAAARLHSIPRGRSRCCATPAPGRRRTATCRTRSTRAKRPTNIIFRPSDQNLWALWLAAEYAAATGDLAAFDAPLAYHPLRQTAAVPLREHLRRQFRFFVDVVGRGERGHVRILNADWNDVAIADSGVDRQTDDRARRLGAELGHGGVGAVDRSPGSPMRLGETALAGEARAQADELRALVAQAWNGRWFHRAYAPGVAPVGDDDCWLEVQPWAILCGAADAAQARVAARHDRSRTPRRLAARRAAALAGARGPGRGRHAGATPPAAASGTRST